MTWKTSKSIQFSLPDSTSDSKYHRLLSFLSVVNRFISSTVLHSHRRDGALLHHAVRFYEGHTDYRADPITIAWIFGLRNIEQIEAAFDEGAVRNPNTAFHQSGRAAWTRIRIERMRSCHSSTMIEQILLVKNSMNGILPGK